MGFAGSARAVAIAVVLLASGLGALLAAPMAEAQSSPPWYGVADRSRPTEGFAFRVPVVVENDRTHSLNSDTVVHVNLDFRKLLVEAGWTNETAGVDVVPRGFTLDPDSIRVVEYDRGFRDFKERTGAGEPILTPHMFYPSLFDVPMRGREFHPTTDPVGTVTFLLKAPVRTEELRYFYVYFHALQYQKTAPASFREIDVGALHAYGWSGLGQVFYGREVGAAGNANRLDVRAFYPDTTVTFYTYALGQPRLYQPGHGITNPLVLLNQTNGPEKSYSLPQNEFFKIVADKPILVSGRGALKTSTGTDQYASAYGAGGFVVGNDGQYRSTSFRVPLYAPDLWVYATESGVTNVMADSPAGSTTLGSATPAARILTDYQVGSGDPTYVTITSTKPILVQYGGVKDVRRSYQVPALSGAPTGTSFYSMDVLDDRVLLRPRADTGVRVYQPENPAVQVYPPGQSGVTPPQQLAGGCEGLRDLKVNHTFQANVPFAVRAEPARNGPAAHLSLVAGGPAQLPAGYYGGQGGQRIFAIGPAAIAGYFDETKMKVTECRLSARQATSVETSVPLNRDGLYLLEGPRPDPLAPEFTLTGIYEITSNKPVSVFSTAASDNYVRVVAARPVPPKITVGALEFRGHLVDLRSAEQATSQPYKTTGPNVPVDFRLTALNLGRWIGGENLPDTIRISCSSDRAAWEIRGCDQEFRLGSASAQGFTLSVNPKDAPPRDRGVVTVTATSSGAPGVTATLLLIVRVEVTYGVGTWFDVENGLKLIDPPVSLNPGETHAYRVVVKNTGSVEDTFELERVPRVLPEGWTARLVRNVGDAEEVRRVTLVPGESDTLRLVVQAPADLSAFTPKFFDTTIKATSISSASATDKVTAQTRIRAEIEFELDVDERTKLGAPGKPVAFTLSLLNRGNDIARITLGQAGLLPAGWSSRILDPSGSPLEEINLGLGPPFNATLEVTPPEGARAGEIATVRISAETTVGEERRVEEISATVLVRQVHNLTIPEPAELRLRPGQTLRYVLDVTNVGNGDELVELIPSSLRPAWRITAPAGLAIDVPEGGSAPFEVALTVPEATEAGFYEVNFTLRLSREAQRNVTLPVVVQSVRQLAFTAPAAIEVSPGQAFRFPLDVRNTGNVRDVATLGADLPAAWGARFEPATVILEPGASTRVTLVLNASRDAPDGDHAMAFTAAFAGAPDESRGEASVKVGRPDLRMGEPLAQGSTRRGEVLIVTVPITNEGGMEAKDVRVALVVDGEVVDTVVLNRVLPGVAAQPATLTWVVDRSVREVKVVVNPDGTIVEPDGDGARKEASVQYARPVPAAPVGALAALAAALALALGPRRRRS